MRIVGLWGCLLLTMAPLLAQPSMAEPASAMQKSTGASKQFIVYGRALRLRGAFLQLGEEINRDFIQITSLPDEFHSSMILRVDADPLSGAEGVALRPQIRPLEFGGFHLQLDIFLNDDFEREDLEREIVRMLFADQILGRLDGDLSGFQGGKLLPDWLMAGTHEAIRFQREARVRGEISTIWKSGKAMMPKDLLEADRKSFSPLEQKIFDASACGMVLALRRQTESGKSMDRFLKQLTVPGSSDRQRLLKSYPGLIGSSQSLEKWLSVEMAALAEPVVFDSWGAADTDDKIDMALTLIFPEDAPKVAEKPRKLLGVIPLKPKAKDPADNAAGSKEKEKAKMRTLPLTAFREIAKRTDRARITTRNLRLLNIINTRGFPPLRSVVDSYRGIFDGIVAGSMSAEETDAELARLAAIRVTIRRNTKQAEYYLDWMEATQNPERSDSFDEYLRVMEDLGQDLPPRSDPISRYLDALEFEIR